MNTSLAKEREELRKRAMAVPVVENKKRKVEEIAKKAPPPQPASLENPFPLTPQRRHLFSVTTVLVSLSLAAAGASCHKFIYSSFPINRKHSQETFKTTFFKETSGGFSS